MTMVVWWGGGLVMWWYGGVVVWWCGSDDDGCYDTGHDVDERRCSDVDIDESDDEKPMIFKLSF